MATETTKHAKGNAKGDKWAVVIDPPKKNAKNGTIEELCEILGEYQNTLINYNDFSFIATIIHDKDIEEDGKPKLIHLHAFIETDKRTKSQMLDVLTELLNIDRNAISCDPTNSDILYPQYLIHKNDPNKFQYSSDLVKSNNLTKYMKLISRVYKRPLTEEELQEIIESAKTLKEVGHKIGIKLANQYRTYFNQIREEEDQTKEIQRLNWIVDTLQEENDKLKHLLKTMIDRAEFYLPRENKNALGLDSIKANLDRINGK
jgi:hypothetical protein